MNSWNREQIRRLIPEHLRPQGTSSTQNLFCHICGKTITLSEFSQRQLWRRCGPGQRCATEWTIGQSEEITHWQVECNLCSLSRTLAEEIQELPRAESLRTQAEINLMEMLQAIRQGEHIRTRIYEEHVTVDTGLQAAVVTSQAQTQTAGPALRLRRDQQSQTEWACNP